MHEPESPDHTVGGKGLLSKSGLNCKKYDKYGKMLHRKQYNKLHKQYNLFLHTRFHIALTMALRAN